MHALVRYVLAAIIGVTASLQAVPEDLPRDWIEPAADTITSPINETDRWNYVMNARIRLLLFWTTSEDVGSGEIVKGSLRSEPSSKVIRLVIGSDPSKTPRKINYWGSAKEIRRPVLRETLFFGFKNAPKATSREEADEETAAKTVFPFDAAISRATPAEFLSRSTSMKSGQDYTSRDLVPAQNAILKTLSGDEGRVRSLTTTREGCLKTSGFLGSVERLVQHAIDRGVVPAMTCYVYNARYYTITLKKNSAVDEKKVEFELRNGKLFERHYKDLRLAKFEVLNTESGGRTNFDLVLGTSGEIRGVPVQIHYQPSYWFQVVLNLDRTDGEIAP